MKVLLFAYLVSFVLANLLVKSFGPYGLLFSSFFLIPFDFVVRCVLHEKYKRKQLFLLILALTVSAALITIAFNWNARNIALASILGFSAAQLMAGIFYQATLKHSYFVKVNLSDLVAIIFDSIIFQLVAFGSINPIVTGMQIVIKFAGGLMWYWIIFKKIKLHEKINSR